MRQTTKQGEPTLKKDETRPLRWTAMVYGDIKRNRDVYALAIPGVLFYIIFCYLPIYGVIIAFKKYTPALGITGSPFVGLTHFKNFFQSIYFVRVVKNTMLLNLYDVLFGFPIPIIFALLLNELRGRFFKRSVQTITYLPHFISIVVICGMIVDFTSSRGFVTALINKFGGNYNNLLQESGMFRSIYIISGIWQNFGWGSIIYLAALAGLDMELYEAAMIDGAKKIRQLIHITLPGIAPTIVVMLILRIGQMMSLGADKIILLYNPMIYDVSDTISSYVYRRGLVNMEYDFSTAVNMFNSVINCALVFGANYISGKFGDNSLF